MNNFHQVRLHKSLKNEASELRNYLYSSCLPFVYVLKSMQMRAFFSQLINLCLQLSPYFGQNISFKETSAKCFSLYLWLLSQRTKKEKRRKKVSDLTWSNTKLIPKDKDNLAILLCFWPSGFRLSPWCCYITVSFRISQMILIFDFFCQYQSNEKGSVNLYLLSSGFRV